ncbi:DUF4352 domain-containing protein [Actinomadura sp. NPDC047616]|uniref:DUF4352 domain-containing protein n=1 Tax=Actinomadura sp. NPDC047616 TaxID=3155914 RepID=UPI0033EBC3C3
MQTNTSHRTRALMGGAYAFLVGAGLAAVTACGPVPDTTEARSSDSGGRATATSSKKRDAEKPVNGIGKTYRDGKFSFTVTKVRKGVRRVGDEYLGQTAQGQFVLVHVTVRNTGDRARTFDAGNQKLIDTSGREFQADSEAVIAMGEESRSFLEEINPGNGVKGILVFDVPRGVKIKAIELHDSMFSGGVTVPLGGD